MSPKRRDRVAPPPVGDEWDVRFGTTEAAKDWPELEKQAATNVRDAFELMRSNPRPLRTHGTSGSVASSRFVITAAAG